jgi:hypothetical protein
VVSKHSARTAARAAEERTETARLLCAGVPGHLREPTRVG